MANFCYAGQYSLRSIHWYHSHPQYAMEARVAVSVTRATASGGGMWLSAKRFWLVRQIARTPLRCVFTLLLNALDHHGTHTHSDLTLHSGVVRSHVASSRSLGPHKYRNLNTRSGRLGCTPRPTQPPAKRRSCALGPRGVAATHPPHYSSRCKCASSLPSCTF